MIKQLNKASILDINCILGAVHSNEKKRINLGPRLLCVRDRKKPYNRDGACSTHSILSGERYRSPSTRRQFGGRRNRSTTVAMVYVPSDSFGGLSPERKGAQVLNTFFTFVAVKIVLAQLEGSSAGRGTTAGAYNPGGHKVLVTFLQDYPLKNNPDLWLGKLMKTDKMIALRIMEVRKAYASVDFEWDNLQKLSLEMLQDENLAVMRKHVHLLE